MKSHLICLCAFILTFMAVPAYTQVTDLSKTNYGIWQTFGDPVSSSINPEIRGRLCNFKWSDIEPSADQWQWKQFDSNLTVRATDALPLIFMVYTEEDAPQWIYSNGVPKVAQKDKKGKLISYAPFYMDPEYKFYFKRMITKVREHVETLPAAVRNQVIAVQACLGSTGDYISYKGDVDPQYRISGSGFYSLFQEFSQAYYDEYKNTSPKIYVLSNPKNNGPDQAAWLFQNCPGGWIKTGSLGKGFQLNDEASKARWLYPMINLPILNGEYVRARSELIGGTTSTGWWNKAPAKNMFALMCYDIYWGLDWNNQGYDQISDNLYDSAYGFYNKYAGEKDPAKSVYAMCALRDGLDASDAVRFPASLYGTVQRGNAGRYINIANDYAPNGAKLEDVTNAMSDENNNLGAKGTNDVGWDVFPGNYERYLHQIKANQTSVGYWNLESANKNDMYGKFGRGFDLASGKDALYFDVEDAFFNNAPLNSKHPIVIEIIYFDNSYGSWQLFYDGGSNKDKPSIHVKGTNSKLWKRASVTINDAYLGNGAESGADFYIKNTGTENVIFSTVELRRPYKGEVMGLSASNVAPFSTVCTNSTSFQTLYLIGSFLRGGNTVVGPLKGFGFSIDSGKTYPDSVIIKDHGAVFSKKIFIKFKPNAEGIFNGDIPVRGDNVAPITIPVVAASVKSSPSLLPVIKPVNCFGSKDGSIDLVCNGGTGPFTYSWSGTSNYKAITEDVNSVGVGSYTVTVNSFGGCVTKTTVQVSGPTALQVSALAPQIPVNQTTENVAVLASGGTAPYTGTGNFIAGPGTYTYTVTDANGCSSSADITITQSQSTLAALANTQNISCHGGFTTVNISATGGKVPYSGIGTFIVSAGTYTYTITDADGTVSSATVIVNEPPLLTANAAAEKISCNGGNTDIVVSAIGGVAPYTGTGNFTVGAGVYTYSVTDANGCPAVKTINLTEPAKLNTAVSADAVLCNGGTTAVAVSAEGGVAPYTGTGNFTVGAGVHNYIVTDANGCTQAQTISLTEPVKINTDALAGTILCNGGKTFVSVVASGGVAPYTGTGNFMVSAGNFNYTVTDANGCQSLNTLNVAEPEALQVIAIAEPISEDKTTTTVSITATGGIAPYTGTGNFAASQGLYNYTVTDANGCKADTILVVTTQLAPLSASAIQGNILCNGGTTTVTVSATGGQAPYTGTGNYTVGAGTYTYTVTDALGKICNATITVTEPAVLMINSITKADVSACKAGTGNIIINTTGGTMPYAYTLNTGSYQLGNQFSNLADGSYTVIVKDNNGCITSAPAVITKSAPMKAWFNQIDDVSSCGFADGSVTVINEGGIAPFDYSINNSGFQTSNKFSNLPENEYTVTIRDSRGCETSALTTIKRNSELKLSVSSSLPVSGCSNDDGEITVIASGGGGTYQYCVNGQPFNGSNTFSGLSIGDYTITVKDWRGCSKSVTASIIKIPALVAKIQSITNEGACGSGDGALQVGLLGGSGPYLYSINGGLLQPQNTFNNLSAGIYTVQVKDGRGCVASAIATIGRTQQMLMTADTTAISCIGGSDGTITVTNSGGVAPFQYSIDDKPFNTRNIFGNLKAGVHPVAIKDNRNCTALFSVTMADGTKNCGLDITGVFNPGADSLFKAVILPNPSPTEFTLIISSASTEKIEILVIDMAGRIVYKASGNANEQYHFGNGFAAGMYAVRIMQGQKAQTIKVIKTRGQ